MPATGRRSRACVVGGGVVGLSAAIELARAGAEVVVRTAGAPAGTTSAVAGAMCGPVFGEPDDPQLRWMTRSDRVFRELAEDPATGVSVRRGRLLTTPAYGPHLAPWAQTVPGFRACTPDELPAGFLAGMWAELPFADMPRYLGWLVDELLRRGGRLELRPVASLDEAAEDVDVVVHCAGLAAAVLASDPDVVPVRGQHVVVEAPQVSEFVYEGGAATSWVGVMPHGRRVVLGGVAEPGRYDLGPDPATTAAILERCTAAVPELAGAPVLSVDVGLRPVRPTVRLEVEDRGGTRVVHDYGHGGNGVLLSWGCAVGVVDLALG